LEFDSDEVDGKDALKDEPGMEDAQEVDAEGPTDASPGTTGRHSKTKKIAPPNQDEYQWTWKV
jgi:hypothetical protein